MKFKAPVVSQCPWKNVLSASGLSFSFLGEWNSLSPSSSEPEHSLSPSWLGICFGIAEAGSVTMSIAFDIVANSRDLTFKRSTLSVFEPYAVNYDINSYSYALLHDDVMAASGEPQKYGTAGQCENGAWVPAAMASTAQVDAAREEIGLGPMAELIEPL